MWPRFYRWQSLIPAWSIHVKQTLVFPLPTYRCPLGFPKWGCPSLKVWAGVVWNLRTPGSPLLRGVSSNLLSFRSIFQWEGIATFPDPPVDGRYPESDPPVTPHNIVSYVKELVKDMKRRARWFKTRNLLWPWVSWGSSLPLKAVMVSTVHFGCPSLLCNWM